MERVATGVSASAELFAQAASWGADAVLVHHGLLWRGEEPARVVGSLRGRLQLLFENDLNLIAYHLPLDRHPAHGNAAILARELGLEQLEPFGSFGGVALGFAGVFPTPIADEELFATGASRVRAAAAGLPRRPRRDRLGRDRDRGRARRLRRGGRGGPRRLRHRRGPRVGHAPRRRGRGPLRRRRPLRHRALRRALDPAIGNASKFIPIPQTARRVVCAIRHAPKGKAAVNPAAFDVAARRSLISACWRCSRTWR